MKKMCLLLAALLVLGLLAGCNNEDKTPDNSKPGYDMGFELDEGWEAAPDSDYDMEVSKDGVKMVSREFASSDFLDMPTLEELFHDCNGDVLENLTDVAVVEEMTSYQVEGKQVVTMLYSGKDVDVSKQYCFFGVAFDNRAESMIWVCYSGSADAIKAQRADLKAVVDSATPDSDAMTWEEMQEHLDSVTSDSDKSQ